MSNTNRNRTLTVRHDSTLARRCEMHAQALLIADDTGFEEWQEIGEHLGYLGEAYQWWVGDWLLFGEQHYGEAYSQGMEATGLAYKTLANYAWVCSRFPVFRRREQLPFSFHAEVAGLESVELQEKLLEQAIADGWSRRELRDAVRKAKGKAPAPTPRSWSGVGFVPSREAVEGFVSGDKPSLMVLQNRPSGDSVRVAWTLEEVEADGADS